MSKTAKTVASSHQFLGGSWTFFKLAAAPIGIFAALHSSSLCNSLLCPGCRQRWCFGNLRIPMVVPLPSSRYFCKPPWPEILWGRRRLWLSMLRCGLLHLLVPWEKNTSSAWVKWKIYMENLQFTRTLTLNTLILWRVSRGFLILSKMLEVWKVEVRDTR